MRHALVNKDNIVTNVIVWDGAEWLPPKGYWVVQHDSVDIGDVYDKDNNVFIRTIKYYDEKGNVSREETIKL